MNTQTFPEETCKFVHKIKDSLIRQPNDKESFLLLWALCLLQSDQSTPRKF